MSIRRVYSGCVFSRRVGIGVFCRSFIFFYVVLGGLSESGGYTEVILVELLNYSFFS